MPLNVRDTPGEGVNDPVGLDDRLKVAVIVAVIVSNRVPDPERDVVFVWPIDCVIVRSTLPVSVAEGETVPDTLKVIDQLLDPNSVCESLGVFVSDCAVVRLPLGVTNTLGDRVNVSVVLDDLLDLALSVPEGVSDEVPNPESDAVFVWFIDSVIERSTLRVSLEEAEAVSVRLDELDLLLDPGTVPEYVSEYTSDRVAVCRMVADNVGMLVPLGDQLNTTVPESVRVAKGVPDPEPDAVFVWPIDCVVVRDKRPVTE